MAVNADPLLLAALPPRIQEAYLLVRLLHYSHPTWTAPFLLSSRPHFRLVTREVQSLMCRVQKLLVSFQNQMALADLEKEV